MENQEIKSLRTRNNTLTEKLVSIYAAYFKVVETGGDHAEALNEAIEKSMDIDMKFILELAQKRGAGKSGKSDKFLM